jgi:hypothetical protein
MESAMMRNLAAVLFTLAVLPCSLYAAEIEGKLKSVDADKGVITLTIGEKDRDFTVTKDTEMEVQDIRAYIPKEGLKDPVFEKKGLKVVIKTAEKDGKETVTKVTIYTGRKG